MAPHPLSSRSPSSLLLYSEERTAIDPMDRGLQASADAYQRDDNQPRHATPIGAGPRLLSHFPTLPAPRPRHRIPVPHTSSRCAARRTPGAPPARPPVVLAYQRQMIFRSVSGSGSFSISSNGTSQAAPPHVRGSPHRSQTRNRTTTSAPSLERRSLNQAPRCSRSMGCPAPPPP